MVVDAEVSQANKTTLRSEYSGVLEKEKKVTKKLRKERKKDLTGPTLLEITGYATNRDLPGKWIIFREDLDFFTSQCQPLASPSDWLGPSQLHPPPASSFFAKQESALPK